MLYITNGAALHIVCGKIPSTVYILQAPYNLQLVLHLNIHDTYFKTIQPANIISAL